jgi:hypothetical protein
VNSSRAIHPRSLPAFAALVPLALLAIAAVGCPSSNDELDGAGGGDDDGSGDGDGDGAGGDDSTGEPGANQCFGPDECIAVSSTCCECPSFAIPGDSSYDDGCDQIECEEKLDCPAVEAACIDEQCQLICTPVPATEVCANGFERDSFGCLVNACRSTPPSEFFACAGDAECVQVPADCCGCELGGEDTAVRFDQVDAYRDSLGCEPKPSCPFVPACDPSLVPLCIAQTCTLGPPRDGGGDDGGDDGDGDGSSGEGQFCGVPEYPSCPKGQECILNHPDAGDATRMGVGTCRDA